MISFKIELPIIYNFLETISENDENAFKEKVNKLISQGYKISSTDCSYAGEVGGNVYDCEYWMAILIKG